MKSPNLNVLFLTLNLAGEFIVSPATEVCLLITLVLYLNNVGSTQAPSKDFLLFFLFSDWLKSNHLKG